MAWNSFLLVGAGGAIGSILRYATSLLISTRTFPLATLTVNLAGSLVMGVLLGFSIKNAMSSQAWKFLAIGVCGGFTTFSAFSIEAFRLLQQQRYSVFLLYIVVSITGGILGTIAGFVISKQFYSFKF